MFKWLGMFLGVTAVCFALLYTMIKMSEGEVKYPGQDKFEEINNADTLR